MSKDEQTAEAFDIEAWLSDAHLPETTVRVNKYGHLAARLESLQAEHDAVKQVEAKQPPRRVSQKNVPRSVEIAREMEQVREEMESGWLTIRLRGLTSDELERVNKAKDSDAKTLRSISLQAVEPTLTEAQAKAVREAFGVGQWNLIIEAAAEVAFGKVHAPDFSAGVYATLATGTSSQS